MEERQSYTLCVGTLLLLSLLLLCVPYLVPAPTGSLLSTAHLVPTALESALLEVWRARASAQRARLEAALAQPASALAAGSPFEDVTADLPLPQPFLAQPRSDSDVTGVRSIPFAPQLSALGGGCTMFAAGIATDGGFEEHVASALGCTVHAFDCTLTPGELAAARARYSFTIHRLCLGAGTKVGAAYARGQALKFQPLAAAKAALGVRSLDILKFDIEGGEWGLLASAVLAAREQDLPSQLMFELHTQGANAGYVAPEAVQGKGREQVNRLFLQLLQLGYHVIEKVVNPGDDRCADFVLVRSPPRPHTTAGASGGGAEGSSGRFSPWDEEAAT
jgi:hypothetical protein